MLLELLDKKILELRKFVEQKNIDKFGLNILFACGVMIMLWWEWISSGVYSHEIEFWVAIISVLFVLITIYFAKKVGLVLSIYAILVYCFLDCQINMLMLAYLYYWGDLPLTSNLRCKAVIVIILIYIVLRELQNKNILKFESNTVPKRDNTKIFRVFQFFLLIGAVVFGEIVFVVDIITLGKLPQIVLCIIALTGLAIVICAGYGLDRRYDTKIFLGISPIVYLYKAFGYILVPEFFNEFVTVSYPWMKAMGYIIA